MESNKATAFFQRASQVILDLGTTDKELTSFLKEMYTGDNVSESNLQSINHLMNMRTQRSSLLSNLEEKRHNGAMSIIRNLN